MAETLDGNILFWIFDREKLEATITNQENGEAI